LLFLLLVLVPSSLRAQEPVPLPGGGSASESENEFEWDLGGYFEDTFNVEYLRVEEGFAVLNAARGRLDFSGKYKTRFDFGVSAVGIYYAGRTEIDTVQYFPDRLQGEILPPDPETGFPGTREIFTYEIDNRLYLQEAFGTVYLPHFRLRAGRHKFYSGTGYAFNPIDLFIRKDPLDPTYEVDGLDAVLAAVELPRQTEIETVARFNDDFSNTDYQVRLETYAKGWDVALQYTNSLQERVDWGTLNTEDAMWDIAQGAFLDAYVYRPRWNLIAGELAGEWKGIGLHGEGGYVVVDEPENSEEFSVTSKNHERFLVGMDYTFESQWYVLAEYMRLGEGVSSKSDIELNDRMAFFTGETLVIGKDTVFGRISYPITDLTEISLNTIVNINDPSAIVNPWVLFDIFPAVKLTLTLYVPVGDDESQNGQFGVSGFARIKIFF
jgi:hypothetical protein